MPRRHRSPGPVDEAVSAVARALARCRGPLDQLASIRRVARRLGGLERTYADHAARHYTWEEIGEALGISRQAAWKQYGRPNPSSKQR